MRRAGIFAIIFAVLGLGAWAAGDWSARAWERMVGLRVAQGFDTLGIGWAEVTVDGFRLTLGGRAPDEAARNEALDLVRGIARGIVVTDAMTVRASPPPPRPRLAFAIQRGAEGVTLTGNLAGAAMLEELLAAMGGIGPLHDFAGTNAQRPRPGWGPEIAIAGQAARALELAEIAVVPGRVSVGGIAADGPARDALSRTLEALAAGRVELVLDLRVPRRVIVPFRFAMRRAPSDPAPRFEACAARDATERGELERLVARLDPAPGGGRCEAGLGGPEGDWLGAVRAGVEALGALPSGRIELTGDRVVLTGWPPTGEADFLAAMTALAAALPDGFVLTGRIEEAPEAAWARARLVYWLRAARAADGAVRLEGVAPGGVVRDAVVAYAAALFGGGRVAADVSVSDLAPPPGWHGAALGALSGLALLGEGSAEVSGGRVALTGTAPDAATAAAAHALLAAAPGHVAESRITADLAAAFAALPLPAEACAARLGARLAETPILFDPGKRSIAAGSRALVAEIAGILGRCPDAAFEIAGHTDSQGADDMNLRLSRARAEAVLDALVAAGIAPERLAAEGYGETVPMADNDTPEGRALNRRIEFRPVLEAAE